MRTVVVFACVLLCAAENVIITKPGGTAIFNCGIKDVSSTNLKWQRGTDTLLTINLKTGISSRGNGEIGQRSQRMNEKDLKISQVKEEDAGQFICTAGRQQEEHRLIVVSVSVSPSSSLVVGGLANLQCNVAGLTPGLVAEWKRPNGQRESSQKVKLEPVAQTDEGRWECGVTVGGEYKSEALDIVVKEPGPKTTSGPLTTGIVKGVRPKDNTSTCSDCGDSTSSTTLAGLSWWIWVAVGGGCLVVVLLWVLVLGLCHRMKRRKKRFMKMRNAAQLKPKQYCQCPNPAAAPGGRQEPTAPPLPPLLVQCR